MSLLTGIKILDLTRILAGPWATQLLADYGAEVIKVEQPQKGDDTRYWGPPWVDINGEKVASYFACANRGKKSVAVDIKSKQGQSAILELVKECDVFIENFKVGDLARFSLDYSSLSKINPKLIYCSITGFGQTGPLAKEPGFDAMIQAMGGLMSITGQPDDKNGEPTKVGVAVADLITGMYAANSILAAYIGAQKTGKGQHIDVSLFDCQLAMLANQGANYLATNKNPTRLGNAHPNIVPYQTFQTQNGHIMIAVGNNKQFVALCRVLNLNDLAEKPEYLTNEQRVKNRQLLIDKLQDTIQAWTSQSLTKALKQANVPCSLVNNIQQALNHPQTKARGLVKSIKQADGEFRYIGNPIKFSDFEYTENKLPPKLPD